MLRRFQQMIVLNEDRPGVSKRSCASQQPQTGEREAKHYTALAGRGMVADPNRRVVPPSPAWSWLSALVPPSSRPQHSSPSPSALDTDIAYCPFRFPSARRHASRHPHSGLDALSKTWTTFDSSADRRNRSIPARMESCNSLAPIASLLATRLPEGATEKTTPGITGQVE
ncbi:hypothetical protein BKA80DRAFT_320211 [Phyllosticta citrichinensis]